MSYRYGIEGIAQTYADPFGLHKIDIRMDDIVEDARREVEVLLSIWENQNHGKPHEHEHKGCNMFVPMARPMSSSTMDSDDSNPFTKNGGAQVPKTVGVRWADDEGTGCENSKKGSVTPVSPGDVGFEDTASHDLSFSAKKVKWGSFVGSNDQGTFEAPDYFAEQQSFK
jgi:hypothetical protein